MRPWRPYEILHIGVEPVHNVDKLRNVKRLEILGARNINSIKESELIYFQWCKIPKPNKLNSLTPFYEMKTCPSDAVSCNSEYAPNNDAIDDKSTGVSTALVSVQNKERIGVSYTLSDLDVFTSSRCETKYIGSLNI